jgi:hypothetical protein
MTQYIDAFQRAQCCDVIIIRNTYHVKLGPIATLAPIMIKVFSEQRTLVACVLFKVCVRSSDDKEGEICVCRKIKRLNI